MKLLKHLAFFFAISAYSQQLSVTPFATDFWFPTEIAHANDDRLFVVEKAGKIKIVQPDGIVNETPFLSFPDGTITTQVEAGLLGLAFHPEYLENGFFYIYYARIDGMAVISRFSVGPDPDIADPDSEEIILMMPHPFPAHYGGTLKFGPDGLLYISTGDGGDEFELGIKSQDINDNFGKILRLDVDAPSPYIPAGNPFIEADGNDEIWALGFRNPWKFSFDRQTGDMIITDVGQAQIEEINKITAPLTAGLNFGWRCYEGTFPFNITNCLAAEDMVFPTAQYNHDEGCAVIGGYVYRGAQYPELTGKYIFSDFCLHRIAMMDDDGIITYSETVGENYYFTTLGEDKNGELYITGGHNLYKITSMPLSTADYATPKFSLLPNPANSQFMVKGNEISYPMTIQLIDMTGKILREQNVDNEQWIDVADIQTGFYTVHVTDRSSQKTVMKLLKK